MQQVIDVLGWMLLGAGLLGMPIFGLALVVMHFAMPKALVERYWKSEHFSDFYIGAFTGTLSAPVRTAMLLAAIAVPSIAKKRMMADVLSVTPAWCRRAAKILVATWLVFTFSILIPTFVLSIYFFWQERQMGPSAGPSYTDWKSALALFTLVFCAMFFLVRAVIDRLRSRRSKVKTTRRSRMVNR